MTELDKSTVSAQTASECENTNEDDLDTSDGDKRHLEPLQKQWKEEIYKKLRGYRVNVILCIFLILLLVRLTSAHPLHFQTTMQGLMLPPDGPNRPPTPHPFFEEGRQAAARTLSMLPSNGNPDGPDHAERVLISRLQEVTLAEEEDVEEAVQEVFEQEVKTEEEEDHSYGPQLFLPDPDFQRLQERLPWLAQRIHETLTNPRGWEIISQFARDLGDDIFQFANLEQLVRNTVDQTSSLSEEIIHPYLQGILLALPDEQHVPAYLVFSPVTLYHRFPNLEQLIRTWLSLLSVHLDLCRARAVSSETWTQADPELRYQIVYGWNRTKAELRAYLELLIGDEELHALTRTIALSVITETGDIAIERYPGFMFRARYLRRYQAVTMQHCQFLPDYDQVWAVAVADTIARAHARYMPPHSPSDTNPVSLDPLPDLLAVVAHFQFPELFWEDDDEMEDEDVDDDFFSEDQWVQNINGMDDSPPDSLTPDPNSPLHSSVRINGILPVSSFCICRCSA